MTMGTDVVLLRLEETQTENLLCENAFLFQMPKNIDGLITTPSIEFDVIKNTADESATISVQSDNLAIYVVLTTRAQGRFSENAFALRPFETKVCR